MSYWEALYGSQYYEIQQKGKDGNKGRLNANLFFSAMIVLMIVAMMLICIHFIPGFNEQLANSIRKIFSVSSGKNIGRLLAIPLLGIIYLVVNTTVGNKNNFQRKVDTFMQYPDEIKKKANAIVLVPFFILLGVVLVLSFI